MHPLKIPDLRVKHNFNFESLGVGITLTSNQSSVLLKIKNRISDILPINWREKKTCQAVCNFHFLIDSKSGRYSLYENEVLIISDVKFYDGFERLTSKIRLTIAEFSKRKIFLHAGAVGLGKAALIIPGKSFAGKTTLVAEFVRQGCTYFSDEYALLDKKGLVHPFTKKLSMRGIIDDYRQVDVEVERLGGQRAFKPLPVRYILLTEYKKGSVIKMEQVSAGEGVMKSIENSISIRQNPQLVIETLHTIATQSYILKGTRGEVQEFVRVFMKYINNLEAVSSR